MVQAILGGRKTQTRRVINPQPESHHWEQIEGHQLHMSMFETSKGFCAKFFHSIPGNTDEWMWRRSPYGKPGDLLWVRETWAQIKNKAGERKLVYAAAGKENIHIGYPCSWSWKPSIHMPKKFCRIWLKVKDIRVERLQDISNIDALSEGVSILDPDVVRPGYYEECAVAFGDCKKPPLGPGPIERFQYLWDSINKKDGPDISWKTNPWVWVIEFERIER